jgi:hypothetical protein
MDLYQERERAGLEGDVRSKSNKPYSNVTNKSLSMVSAMGGAF